MILSFLTAAPQIVIEDGNLEMTKMFTYISWDSVLSGQMPGRTVEQKHGHAVVYAKHREVLKLFQKIYLHYVHMCRRMCPRDPESVIDPSG